MKSLFLILLLISPVRASELQYRKTTCNARYNNLGIVAPNIKCSAWFNSQQNLIRVRWFYPQTNSYYDFDVRSKSVFMDPKWKECIRYQFPEGNQWQICTVPSPTQLNIKAD
jgi:hypothetical protein